MKKILLAIAIASQAYGSNWDVEYWQYFRKTNFQRGALKVYTSGVVRLDKDISRFYYYRLSENVAYSPVCWLDLEFHYSFIYSKPPGNPSFNTINRLELEVNPIFDFCTVNIRWRNRLQIVRKQHISEWQYVLRERLMLRVPVCLCPLVSINFYDELFYDYNRKKVTENRLVPLELSFSFCIIDLDLFFMVRNFYNDKWYNSFVFGTEIAF